MGIFYSLKGRQPHCNGSKQGEKEKEKLTQQLFSKKSASPRRVKEYEATISFGPKGGVVVAVQQAFNDCRKFIKDYPNTKAITDKITEFIGLGNQPFFRDTSVHGVLSKLSLKSQCHDEGLSMIRTLLHS